MIAESTGPTTHRNQKSVPTDSVERRALIYDFLMEHPMFDVARTYSFHPADKPLLSKEYHDLIDIEFVYVDPSNETIDTKDASKNTAFRVWLEAGPMYDMSESGNQEPPKGGWNDFNKWVPSHDVDLDCGAPDLETALCVLANLIDVFYDPETGQDRVDRPKQCAATYTDDIIDVEHHVSGCTAADDGFCVRCGFRTERTRILLDSIEARQAAKP